MWWFLIPLLLGFTLNAASAFTAAYSRRWGDLGKAPELTSKTIHASASS